MICNRNESTPKIWSCQVKFSVSYTNMRGFLFLIIIDYTFTVRKSNCLLQKCVTSLENIN